MKKPLLGLKLRQQSRRRVASLVVPGADVLANIAAKDVLAHGWPQLFRNCAALFNGEIGNAKTGIELARGHNGLRRAGVNAARTASATVGRGDVRGKIE